MNTTSPDFINSADIPTGGGAEKTRKIERVLDKNSPYKETIDFIKDAPKHFNEKQLAGWILPENMKKLLDQIESDANDNLFVRREKSATHPGMVSETVISFDAIILEQIDYAISDSSGEGEPVLERWDTHMTRQNGLRDAVALLLEDSRLREPFIAAVHARQAELIKARDGVESESKFSPEELSRVAEDVGKEATESAPVILDVGTASQAARSMISGETAVAPERHPKRARIFAPYTEPVIPPSSISSERYYDAMINKDDEELEKVRQIREQEDIANAPLKKEKENYRRLVNEDTIGYSVETLTSSLRFDTELKSILHDAGFDTVTEETITALRENEDLRYKVGEYFLQKLDTMVRISPGDFGPRVVADAQKRGDYVEIPGMPSTTSREYAAWLALTKVSGMFNYKAERESDGERYDASGRLNNAQHRNAADQVLYSGPARYY